MSTPVLQADTLTKAFGAHTALRGVSLQVRSGEAVGLLGPNGAGKTTTVKILTGLVRPSSGTARLFGQPAGDPAARTRLGYLPELFRFPEWMTGRQVVDLHAQLAGVSKTQRRQRVDDALDRVGLGARGADRVRGYSKGMSQRLGMAQAIVGRPELLLLDEPTSALDPVGRREVRDLICELKAEGVAVLLNSHLLSEVERVCDRLVVLNQGQVRFAGQLSELTATTTHLAVSVGRPDGALLDALLDFGVPQQVAPNQIRLRLTPPWDAQPETSAEQVAAAIVAGPWGLQGLSLEHESLEDAFVELVDGGDR